MDTATQVADTVDPDAEAILAQIDALPDEPSPDGADTPSVPDAQPPAPDDAVPADAPTDVPDDAQDAASPPSPADPASPTTPEVVPEPFAFTVDAKRIAVEGATVTGDTITLTRDAFQRQIQPYLADRAGLARQRQALEAQLGQKSVREAQFAQWAEGLQAIAGKSEDERIEWAIELAATLPQKFKDMEKDAKIAVLEARSQPLQQLASDQQAQVTEQQVTDWLDASIHAYLDTPAFHDLKGNTRFVQRVQRQLKLGLGLILSEGRDANGQPALQADWQRFQSILDAEATDAREIAEQAKRVQQYEAAAKANAQTRAKPIPPAVSATGKPTGAVKVTSPQTKDDYEAMIERLAAGEDISI